MKDTTLVQVGDSTWQTPINGDFSHYVEELTGGIARVSLDEPGRVRRWTERAAQTTLVPIDVANRQDFGVVHAPAGAAAVPPDAKTGEFALRMGSVSHSFAAVRWGLLVITALQVGLLVVLSLGSVFGVAASLLIWWILGRLQQFLDGVGAGVGAGAGSGAAVLQRVRKELQAQAARTVKQKSS